MDIPFKQALDNAGYKGAYSTSESKDDDGNVNGTTISFNFEKPKSKQPPNRNEVFDKGILTADLIESDAYEVIKNGKKIDKEMINDVKDGVKDTAKTTIKSIVNKGEEAIKYVKEEVGKWKN